MIRDWFKSRKALIEELACYRDRIYPTMRSNIEHHKAMVHTLREIQAMKDERIAILEGGLHKIADITTASSLLLSSSAARLLQ